MKNQKVIIIVLVSLVVLLILFIGYLFISNDYLKKEMNKTTTTLTTTTKVNYVDVQKSTFKIKVASILAAAEAEYQLNLLLGEIKGTLVNVSNGTAYCYPITLLNNDGANFIGYSGYTIVYLDSASQATIYAYLSNDQFSISKVQEKNINTMVYDAPNSEFNCPENFIPW